MVWKYRGIYEFFYPSCVTITLAPHKRAPAVRFLRILSLRMLYCHPKLDLEKVLTQVAGTPPFHNVGFKKLLVETLNSVGHPTRCPQPLNSVRLMVSYIV